MTNHFLSTSRTTVPEALRRVKKGWARIAIQNAKTGKQITFTMQASALRDKKVMMLHNVDVIQPSQDIHKLMRITYIIIVGIDQFNDAISMDVPANTEVDTSYDVIAPVIALITASLKQLLVLMSIGYDVAELLLPSN
jgi:hypothetical protein